MERVERPDRWVLNKVLSILLRAVYAIGVLVYLAFYTKGFSFFQEFVVITVALIIYGAAESVVRVLRAEKKGWWW